MLSRFLDKKPLSKFAMLGATFKEAREAQTAEPPRAVEAAKPAPHSKAKKSAVAQRRSRERAARATAAKSRSGAQLNMRIDELDKHFITEAARKRGLSIATFVVAAARAFDGDAS